MAITKNPMSIEELNDESLPLYQGVLLADVRLVVSAEQAQAGLAVLQAADVIGFDTESKPTFVKGQTSDGPHLVQLATDDIVYLFPVGRYPTGAALKTILESPHVLKVGFGLSDDTKRLRQALNIEAASVLDLGVALRETKRNDLGAKTAVARFFGMRLQKSKRTATTNWSQPQLTERQMLYAANDAQVALRVYRQWQKNGGTVAAET